MAVVVHRTTFEYHVGEGIFGQYRAEPNGPWVHDPNVSAVLSGDTPIVPVVDWIWVSDTIIEMTQEEKDARDQAAAAAIVAALAILQTANMVELVVTLNRNTVEMYAAVDAAVVLSWDNLDLNIDLTGNLGPGEITFSDLPGAGCARRITIEVVEGGGGGFTIASDAWTGVDWGSSGAPVFGGAAGESKIVDLYFNGVKITGVVKGGGGGSGGSSVWSPDSIPASPHSLDDEFNGTSLDGAWTEFDQNTLLTTAVEDSQLKMTRAHAAGTDITGIYKAVPAVSDYSIVAKVAVQHFGSGVYVAGLFLSEDLAAAPTTANWFLYGPSLGDAEVVTINRASYTSAGTPLNKQLLVQRLAMYLRIRVASGPVVDIDLSWDGIAWKEVAANVATGLSSIVHYGFHFDNRMGSDRLFLADFVRVTESSSFDQIIGGYL